MSATWTTIILAVGGAIGALVGLQQTRRAEEDRVLALTAESTQRPMASDRHIIGSACAREREQRRLVHEQRELRGEPPEKSSPLRLEDYEVAALFRVLWYFARVHALYRALPGWRRKRLRTLLLDSLEPTITSWVKDCDQFKFEGLGPPKRPIAGRTREALAVNLEASSEPLRELAKLLNGRKAH